MATQNHPAALNNSLGGSRMVLLLAALLICLGSALQLGALGYGSIRPANLWMISVIAPNTWNTLAGILNAPYWQEVRQFWPLILVAIGVGIGFAARRGNRPADGMNGEKGESHV
ncbi:MAG TPA: hypothetical protein VEG64_09205 [Candidatus Sulfotelmatobacter sp.]|nr:hypothetical protein [Candidatus Sulfotelmatobacter sp.]